MAATKEEIKAYMDMLYRKPKSDLITMVKQSHRVVDVSGISKDTCVSMLLEAKFGRKYDSILFGNTHFENGRRRALERLQNGIPSPFTAHDLRRSLGRFDIYQKDNSPFITAYDSSDINQTPVYDGTSMSEAVAACQKRMTEKGKS